MVDRLPPVPRDRSHRGDVWAAEWDRAHRALAPYGRAPSRHLIDRLVDEPNRAWLRGRYGELADATIATGGFLQADGRTLWTKRLLDPTTMSIRMVGVVLDVDGKTIITVYLR